MPKSTPPPLKPFRPPNPTTPPRLNPFPSGSSTSSTLQRPTLESYLREHRSSMTGDSPLTWPAIGGTVTESTVSMQPERGSMPASPLVEEYKILPSTASAPLERPTGSVTSSNWETPWGTSAERSGRGTTPPTVLKRPGEPEVGLPSKRRVMSSPRLVPSSRYAFCQELSPELAHEGGPCTCFCGVR